MRLWLVVMVTAVAAGMEYNFSHSFLNPSHYAELVWDSDTRLVDADGYDCKIPAPETLMRNDTTFADLLNVEAILDQAKLIVNRTHQQCRKSSTSFFGSSVLLGVRRLINGDANKILRFLISFQNISSSFTNYFIPQCSEKKKIKSH